MKTDETQLGTMLHALQERAKELNCLYQVGELLNQPERPLPDILRAIAEVLPPGWQYPSECQARIIFEGRTHQAPDFQPTPWVQKARIVVQRETVGSVEVSYRREMPRADEGPFLKEERKLIETIAERIASAVTQRRLRAAFEGWAAADAAASAAGEWRVVLEFLRDTDPALLKRISRKLINHLSWSGVEEAKELLRQGAAALQPDPTLASDDNRPLPQDFPGSSRDLTGEVFRIAGQHMSESEILNSVTRWIKEDKASFLVRALENQDTSLGEVMECLERYRHIGVEEDELSFYTQTGLRVSLIRRFFSESLGFINVAKKFIDVKDFYDLLDRVIFPAGCHGKLGGKSAGLFLAKKIVDKAPEASALLREVKVPKTWYVTSDWIQDFVHHNDLEDVLNRKYMEIDQVRQEYPHLVALFKRSSFPSEFAKGLALALDDLGDVPLIVRSSSLLEDRPGSAFSGKYKSLFLGNQGSKEDRLAALMDAIAEVYASIFGPDPTEYRAERGLLDVHEEMGIMIQEVVGQPVGKYFLPACSGVAFSNNEFRWSARIKREDGLIRLVPGLGTRAVDRVADDYPVLIAPGQPSLRVNVTADEVLRYAPKRIDLINLESNEFETIDLRDLLREAGASYPQIRDLVSLVGHDRIEPVIGLLPDFGSQEAVFTFEGLIRRSPFVARIRELLELLQSRLETPVDIEFAYDGKDFYLLQCRPQSYGASAVPVAIPQNLPADKIIFSARHFVSNGKVSDITHIVYVDLEGYSQLPDQEAMHDVGRAVGRLNKLLPKHQFILIGPGRWGSRGDIKLGVPVTYSDINNTGMLIEVARQKGNYLPELSFGTHFFQDLVEAAIRYLPLYPDDPSTTFNEAFFRHSRNVLQELLPEFSHLEETLRVIDVPLQTGGLTLRVLMNADLQQAVGFLSVPQKEMEALESESGAADRTTNDHWRWRFRMAQRIAADLDPQQFGVDAFYVIGSTKNATAGPASDIDVLLHFRGTESQRKELLLWLEGWSRCLAEINFLRTGYRTDQLLDVHLVTDRDIEERSSFAVKIGAITDPARKLPMKGSPA
ncbi:MAG TPA: PEP/pyruvate-binding domain-containing protein [Candidatus Sulfotelmatobacter sp.]|nr:PEP/pyruvate-binding domain-containing protein [Candidatus Sulfotelmatobacter sp.]